MMKKGIIFLSIIIIFCTTIGGLLATWCNLEGFLWWVFVGIFYVETILVLGAII